MSRNFKTLLIALALTGAFGAKAMAQYPPVLQPVENPITVDKAILGKILFWDEQLSSTNSMACGTCHFPSQGGTDARSGDDDSLHPGANGTFGDGDETIGSKGVLSASFGGQLNDDGTFFPNVQVTGRKTPSNLDATNFPDLFWDGRATSEFIDPQTGAVAIAAGGGLESQSVGPPLSNVEMAHGNRGWDSIVFKIDRVDPLRLATNLTPDIQAALAVNPTYPALFAAAFGPAMPGDPLVSSKRIAFAIATYQRTLISDQTPYDDFVAGNMSALTLAQQNGLTAFQGAAMCTTCHAGELFSTGQFFNTGVVDPNIDIGRMAVTMDSLDLGLMKTPGLRNVGLREPTGLFHHGVGNGSSLTNVVSFYNTGPNFTQNTSPLIFALGLGAGTVADIADFLRFGLTDPRAASETGVFSRPTLRSEEDALQNPATSSRFFFGGLAALQHAAGHTPKMLVEGPPSRENTFFTIGLGNTNSNTTAYLVSGDLEPSGIVGSIPFPVFIQNNAQLEITGIITQGGANPGDGFGSFTISISDNPALVGFVVSAQWFVVDLAATNGFASTEAVRLSILP
ncbi:MAG: cytochrome c peroxidase [Planctomycetota bacterium]